MVLNHCNGFCVLHEWSCNAAGQLIVPWAEHSLERWTFLPCSLTAGCHNRKVFSNVKKQNQLDLMRASADAGVASVRPRGHSSKRICVNPEESTYVYFFGIIIIIIFVTVADLSFSNCCLTLSVLWSYFWCLVVMAERSWTMKALQSQSTILLKLSLKMFQSISWY